MNNNIIENNNLIEIKDLYKIYKNGNNEVRALDGVSINIKENEFVSIIGQSGSGKSTLMNMIGLLDKPTKGEYYINGKDTKSLSENEEALMRNEEIGFIFQGFNLLPSLDAIGNVELPLIYRGIGKSKRREMAIKALESVGLGERINHKPSEMSGGQQQRVAIARALAGNPPILLADEPTGNLDSKSSREILELLRDLNRKGNTIILITHDNEVANKGKRIITISDGKIISDINNNIIT